MLINHHKTRVFALALSLLYCTHASAASLESLTHLDELAKAYVKANTSLSPDDRLEVHLGQSANQLQLPQCSGSVQVSTPANTTVDTPNTLVMHCEGPEAWQVYVPVTTQIFTKVIVAKLPIPSKESIDEPMLTTAEVDKNQLYLGYFKNMDEVIGQVALSSLPAGTVLTKKNTEKPILIHRNQIISIIASHGAIMVRAEGIAKEEGALRDTIKVLNPSSKRLIDGIVISGSSVEVL